MAPQGAQGRRAVLLERRTQFRARSAHAACGTASDARREISSLAMDTREGLSMASIAGQEGERLRRAAIAGDVAAQTAWAKMLLSLQPPNQREGLSYIGKAAAGGDAEALYLLARYTAAGLVQPATWTEAIALLRRAAEAGWQPARRELGALLGEAPRERDIAGLIGPRAKNIVFSDPRIATVAN